MREDITSHNAIMFIAFVSIIFAIMYSFGYALAAFKSYDNSGNQTNSTSTKPKPMEIIELNSTQNNITNTGLIPIGPVKVIKSKPSGNYTTNNNATLIPIEPVKVIKSKPSGNYTTNNNATLIPIEPPKSRLQPATGINGSNNTIAKLIKPITKEQAAKAEQEANLMLKAYYEKANQQKVGAISTPTTTTRTTMTNSSSQQGLQEQQERQQQQQQPTITENNNTATESFSPTGISGIP